MFFLKRHLPFLILFLCGLLFFLIQFSPHPVARTVEMRGNDWVQIIASLFYVVAIYSISAVHVKKIKRLTPGWGYSMVLLVCLFTTALIGIFNAYDQPGPTSWIYDNIFRPMDATMFALLGFYIASAAFRGFRARSLEAFLLLFSAAVIMLGQTPLGGLIYPGIPDLATWILNVPNLAAKRALTFGIALAAISLSIRIILGIDKSIFGGTKE